MGGGGEALSRILNINYYRNTRIGYGLLEGYISVRRGTAVMLLTWRRAESMAYESHCAQNKSVQKKLKY
jgi:hypothetical protein